MREHAAPQVFVKCLLHVARQRFFVGIARMTQKRAQVLPYEVVEDCLLGATRFVLRAREAERRPRPRRCITATCPRLVSRQHGSTSWRGLCQPWIVLFQVLGAGDPSGPRIPPWRRQVRRAGGRAGPTIAVSMEPRQHRARGRACPAGAVVRPGYPNDRPRSAPSQLSAHRTIARSSRTRAAPPPCHLSRRARSSAPPE